MSLRTQPPLSARTLVVADSRSLAPLALGGHLRRRDQVQVSVNAAAAAFDPGRWEFIVAEDRPRAIAGTGVGAVICA
jgi:hypothetical protein